MKRALTLGCSALLASGLAFGGCGDDDGGGNAIPLNQLEDSYLRGYCELAMDCSSEPFVAMLDGDLDACMDFLGMQGEMSGGMGLIVDSVNAGDTSYDGAAARQCLDALQSASCDAIEAGAPDPACEEVFTGVLPNDESCTLDEQCAGGWCDMSLACPGTCADTVPLNGDCTGSAPCARSLICENDVCIADPGPLALGQDCADSERSCTYSSWCDYEITGQCVARVGVGQTCDWDEMCQDGLYCTDEGLCAEVQIVRTQGGECGGYEVGPFCSLAEGLGCVMEWAGQEAVGTVCQPLRQVNDDCLEFDQGTETATMYPCDMLAGLYCDMDTTNMTGVCLAKKDGGAVCEEDEECLSDYCDGTGHCYQESTDPCEEYVAN